MASYIALKILGFKLEVSAHFSLKLQYNYTSVSINYTQQSRCYIIIVECSFAVRKMRGQKRRDKNTAAAVAQ